MTTETCNEICETFECEWCQQPLCLAHADYKMFEWGAICHGCWTAKVHDAIDAETALEEMIAGRSTYRALLSVDASEHSFFCHGCRTRIEEIGAVEFVIASKHFGTRSCCSAKCACDYLEPEDDEESEEE